MTDLKQFRESQGMEASVEYSVRTLDALNLDCLLTIFQHLPLLDLLRLRHQCRSLNHAVCQFLQSSCRKLELNLDANRSGENLERVLDNYNHLESEWSNDYTYHIPPKISSITFSDTIRFHTHLFKNQPHFRCDDMIQVNSAEGLTDQKIDSLVHFLTNCVPNLRKLALLVSHEDYFRSLARLLSPLRKLKVFLIDVNSAMEGGCGYSRYRTSEMVEAICGLPELESLYYFRNWYSISIFCYDHKTETSNIFQPHLLRSGKNFLEVLLPKLRVLHSHYFAFPVGMTFDKVEEISMERYILDSVTKNYFPAVKTLVIDWVFDFYSQLGDSRLSFVNVKVLKLDGCIDNSQRIFDLNSNSMRALNDLPNLEELHCYRVDDNNRGSRNVIVEPNNTIVRLHCQRHLLNCYCEFDSSPDPDFLCNICANEPKKMADFVGIKKYFRRLQLLTNKNPPIVQHFQPETDYYNL